MQKEQQLRVWIQKQKRLISEATEQKDRDYIAMMWQGFLNGLRLTNAITWQEYQELSREIVEYAEGFEAAWEEAETMSDRLKKNTKPQELQLPGNQSNY